MIGFTPALRAASYIGIAPYMLPWSVIPTAGWPSAAAAATTSPMRDAPSSIEYSVCRCRWTNDSAIALASATFVWALAPRSFSTAPGDRAVDELHHCDSITRQYAARPG